VKRGILAGLAAASLLLSQGCSALSQSGQSIGSDISSRFPVNFVYTTLFAKNAILEINSIQSRIDHDPILVPNGPRALAIDPRERGTFLYVVCELGNVLSVVDRRTRLISRNINVGQRPYDVAISPNGTRAFVTNMDDDTVSVIDTQQNIVLQTVALKQPTGASTTPAAPTLSNVRLRPMGIATNATGTRVYVACASGYLTVLEGNPGTIVSGDPSRINTGNNGSPYSAVRNILLTGAVAPLNVAVANLSQEGETVYITDPQSNRLFFANSQNLNSIQTQEVQGTPWGVAVGQNPLTGRPDKLYVTQESLNGIRVFDLANMQGTAIQTEFKNPQHVAVSPNGDEIFVSMSGSNNVSYSRRTLDGQIPLSRFEAFNLQQLDPRFIAPTGDIALGGFLYQ